MRKSPYRHPVKTHIRDGKQVRQYDRGEGDKPDRRSRVVGRNSGEYTVQIVYDGEVESFDVSAPSMETALTRGVEQRSRLVEPNKVIISELM